jgi:hypothetical protein
MSDACRWREVSLVFSDFSIVGGCSLSLLFALVYPVFEELFHGLYRLFWKLGLGEHAFERIREIRVIDDRYHLLQHFPSLCWITSVEVVADAFQFRVCCQCDDIAGVGHPTAVKLDGDQEFGRWNEAGDILFGAFDGLFGGMLSQVFVAPGGVGLSALKRVHQ